MSENFRWRLFGWNKSLPYFFLFLSLFFSLKAEAEALSKRIEAIETDVFELKSFIGSKEPVHVIDAMRLSLGGHLTSSFRGLFGRDTNPVHLFDQAKFRLLFSSELTERLRLFINPDFVLEASSHSFDRSDRNFGSLSLTTRLMIAWLSYEINSHLNVRLGRYITQFSLLNIEHWDTLFLSDIEPIFIRHMHHDHMTPRHMIGGELFGKFPFWEERLSYSLYLGTFDHMIEKVMGGGRLISQIGTFLKWGVSLFSGHRQNEPYQSIGTDFHVEVGDFELKSEFAYSGSHDNPNRLGAYLQPALTVGKVIFFGRADYWDEDLAGHFRNEGQRFEYMAGINWLPHPILRNRLFFIVSDYDRSIDSLGGDRDYFEVHASFTVSF